MQFEMYRCMTISVSLLPHALVTPKTDGFVLETNTFGTGDKVLRAGDEHFSAGDKRVENACFKLKTHSTCTCSGDHNVVHVHA